MLDELRWIAKSMVFYVRFMPGKPLWGDAHDRGEGGTGHGQR
jgi:hypothetical protein